MINTRNLKVAGLSLLLGIASIESGCETQSHRNSNNIMRKTDGSIDWEHYSGQIYDVNKIPLCSLSQRLIDDCKSQSENYQKDIINQNP